MFYLYEANSNQSQPQSAQILVNFYATKNNNFLNFSHLKSL